MPRDLDSLVRLQQAMLDAEEARRQLEGVPDSMREIHDQHQERTLRMQALEEQIQAAELERRTEEAAANDAQTKLGHYQEQINRVTTQREYGSLLKEIDTVNSAISEHEERALALLEQIETAQSELEEEKEAFAELDRQYQEQLSQWELDKPSVAARLRELEEETSQLRKLLPRSLLAQFQRLYERHSGNALAAVSKAQISPRAPAMWHCSVCNYSVRPQAIVEIKNNGALIPCESCHRFLYLEEDD